MRTNRLWIELCGSSRRSGLVISGRPPRQIGAEDQRDGGDNKPSRIIALRKGSWSDSGEGPTLEGAGSIRPSRPVRVAADPPVRSPVLRLLGQTLCGKPEPRPEPSAVRQELVQT